MKRSLFISIIALLISTVTFSQKYSTKTGDIVFEASVPSFEEVKAKNTSVSAILNAENANFAALVLIKGFRFKVALMEEHFNENYIESEKYPKATLKGTIENFSMESLAEGEKKYLLQGALTLHGRTKELAIPITLKMINGMVELTSSFTLNPADFDIVIPKIVRNKVAEKVDVSVHFQLSN